MSTASTQSKKTNPHILTLRQTNRSSGNGPHSRKRVVPQNEAYIFALRVAYLSYLLQPRAKRTQHVPAPLVPVQRSSSSINDLMKDFTLLRDSKSTRFPHGFMAELEKRLTRVLMGKEELERLEYGDATVKRTFAVFLNAFKEQGFRKRMEKDRRVEDLVLIFFSNATKELQKGKAPSDDGWKLMVDRHVALFIRLISLILKDHDWARERPELAGRLATLESKLLAHDQDLAAGSSRNGGAGGSTVEVIVPLSYEIKDMPLVQVVARVFGFSKVQVKSDIDKNKSVWTETAALQDLKTYQNLLNLNSKKTLRSDDFDLEESYETWRKAEAPDLSQMMLAIMQSNPELAKFSSSSSLPQFNSGVNGSATPDSSYSRKMSEVSDGSSYIIDHPVDMTSLSSMIENAELLHDDDNPFVYIPPEPRAYYRTILAQALTHDLTDPDLQPIPATADAPAVRLLSKPTSELLNEICIRWRIPPVSRIILFLDVVREKFVDQEISLDTLDAAFNFIKEPLTENKKHPNFMSSLVFDRRKWTLADFALNQQLLTALHEALLRDLYDTMLHCYGEKPPSVGPVMYVLENHIYDDPHFSKSPEDLKVFTQQLQEGLREKAFEIYKGFLEAKLPQDQQSWEFFHVIELGKVVMALAQRIQKRYRKNPEIMGYASPDLF